MDTDDRIQPITRAVAVFVVPFLWLAFLILFFNPNSTGERFAWAIKPHMTAMYMGAGYLGGSWLFINAIFGRQWHRIQGGFLPVTSFTWFMMVATFLHWDQFNLSSLGFTLWLILYIVTPFLVPALWMYNRKTNPGTLETGDIIISSVVLLILKLLSAVALLYAIVGFIVPDFAINTWPWPLTPLTARVMCGSISLLGVGAFTMSNETRWSAWKTPLESILIWHMLVLVGAALNPSDFSKGLLNWYMAAITVMVIATFIFYPMMEMRRRKAK